jgi:peptidoglycan/LPS O-acetylase OafA/YrhL
VDTPAPSGEDDRQAQADKKRIAFVDIGRAVGALLVFYSHIAEQWVHRLHDRFAPIDVVDALTSVPMHMAKQGIGQIAVPVFFLISGFVVTPIALRQGMGRFAVNRLFRVYPPLIFAVLLTAAVLSLGENPLATGQLQTISPLTLLTNSLLINYLIFPQVVLVGVAWTMIIEVTFYVVLVLLLPVLRRSVWLAIAIQLTFVFVVLMTRSVAGPSWSLFAVNVSYLPIPIIGQIIWAGYSRRIQPWLTGLFLAMAWSLYVLADIIDVGRIDSSYNLALAVAVLCFLVGLFAEPRLRERRFWTALSERSYSLYLLHGLAAFVTLDLLRPHMPFALALVVAVAATFGVVELSYRFVEKPSHGLARRFSRSRAESRASAADDPIPAEPAYEADADVEDGWDQDEWGDDEDWVDDDAWSDEDDAPTTMLPAVDPAPMSPPYGFPVAPPSPPYGFPAAGGFQPMSRLPLSHHATPPPATDDAGRIAWPPEQEPSWPPEAWPEAEPDDLAARSAPEGGRPTEVAGPADVPPHMRQAGPAGEAPLGQQPVLPRRGRHGVADEAVTTVAELIAKQAATGRDGRTQGQRGRPEQPGGPEDGAVPGRGWTPPNRSR